MKIYLKLLSYEIIIKEFFLKDSLMGLIHNSDYQKDAKPSECKSEITKSSTNANLSEANNIEVVEKLAKGITTYSKNHLSRLHIYITKDLLSSIFSVFTSKQQQLLKGKSISITENNASLTEFRNMLDIICDLCSDRYCYKYLELMFGVRSVLKNLLLKISSADLGDEGDEISDICASGVSNCELSAAELEPAPPIVVKYVGHQTSVLICPQQRSASSTASSQTQSNSSSSSLGLLSHRTNETVGYVLWGASLVLSHLLIENYSTLFKKTASGNKHRVLEIGSGLGLCGLSLLRHCVQSTENDELPIEEIVLSDFSLPILRNLSYQLDLNLCSVKKSESPKVNTLKIDWDLLSPTVFNGSGSEKNFSIIIGSDLICKESDCIGVAKTLHHYMEYPNGVAYIINGSSKSRYGSERFLEILQSNPYNFDIKEETLSSTKGDFGHTVPESWLLSSHQISEGFDPFEEEGIFVGSAESYIKYEIRYKKI